MQNGPGAENTGSTTGDHPTSEVSLTGAVPTISSSSPASIGGLMHDTEAAVDFLQRFAPAGPWALTAIVQDGKTFTQTFRPVTVDKMREWIEAHQGQRNIYFSVNPTTRDLNSKAKKADIAALAWLHVDVDPRAGEDPVAEKQRGLKVLRAYTPPPTVIIDSGGGVQGFWRLSEPSVIDGNESLAEELEAYNVHLEQALGGDTCHNVDRIMRLPGTINVPNQRKLKKGRKPALAHLVEFHDERTYSLDQFTAAPIVQTGEGGLVGKPKVHVSGNVPRLSDMSDLDQWRVPDYVKMLIVQGDDPDDNTKFGSRSEVLFRVCCELVRCSVPDETIYSVITDPDFGISASVLDKPRSDRYALRQIERAKEDAVDPRLPKLNERYAVIQNIGGKCRVTEDVYDPILGRWKMTRQSFEDFRNAHRNEKVEIGRRDGQSTYKKLGDWWIDHPMRRQYNTIIFAPGREVDGAYNLWRGFNYEPRPGDQHQRFLDHLRHNICGGHEEHYRYLIRWMARAVQQPDSPGEVAVVLRGKRGTGKSFAAKKFGALFGRHFMHVSNSTHLVGNFNAHLRDCIVLFGDEAFYAGDKKHESVLKTLITEEYITIESKGVDAETAPNYAHVLLASNDDWVVPAGAEERRFFVLDVGEGQKQKTAYFAAIDADLQAGGYGNLLHHLRTMDLSDFEVRKAPKTEALRDQKRHSLHPYEKVLLEILQQGVTPDPDYMKKSIPAAISAETFAELVRKSGVSRYSALDAGLFLKPFCAHGPDGKLRKVQPYLYFEQVEIGGRKVKRYIGRKMGQWHQPERPKLNVLRPLAELRAMEPFADVGDFDDQAEWELHAASGEPEPEQDEVPF